MSAAALKMLGSALLALAGALLGGRMLDAQRELRRALLSLSDALGRLSGELTERQTPLPEAFAMLTDEPFFALLSASFGTEPTEALWRRAAQSLPLPEECRTALASLGGVAGRYGAAQQAAEIARVRRVLTERAAALQSEIDARSRRLPGLGAAVGAMLAVLLF